MLYGFECYISIAMAVPKIPVHHTICYSLSCGGGLWSRWPCRLRGEVWGEDFIAAVTLTSLFSTLGWCRF